jgi:hypothetical protein
MTIYQNDTDVVFRLDTGTTNLESATSIKILVQKPSGTEDEWTATRYGTTTYITYTSVSGDLDEIGDYKLQSYIEWGSGHQHTGDVATVTVYSRSNYRLNVSQLIRYFSVYYKNISVQTLTEYNEIPQDGTDSEILYDEFSLMSELAIDELEDILSLRSITLTENQRQVALCHIVADHFEMTNPDWNFRSESMSPGVSFSRGDETGPRAALNKMLDIVEKAARRTSRSGIRMDASSIKRTKDSTNYPRRFKRTSIPSFDFSDDGFDTEQIPDLGGDINDPTW